MTGPLAGIRIIEMGGIGPAPFAGMLLADHGAEVIRVDRRGKRFGPDETMLRSRTLVELDLKNAQDLAMLRALSRTADGLIEGFRPGTMERLGIGPEVLLTDNPRLVYARMTGWGQTGPNAPYAGHDLNYIALSGALHAIGPADHPVPPLALVGDLGGGGMFLAFSICSALLSAKRNGVGQVLDCAMTEGAALLMTAFYEMSARGVWRDQREANTLDGGAHYYGVYRTSDNKFVTIAPIEPQFYRILLERLGIADDPAFAAQNDPSSWPMLRKRLEALFLTRTRDEWCQLLERSDACFAPVLSLAEAPSHLHALARETFLTIDGVKQPAPAPRFSFSTLAAPRRSIAVDAETLLDRLSLQREE